MDLDALKTRLAEQDSKLDRVLRLNSAAVRELQLAKTRSSLRWLVPGAVFELAVAAVAAVWLGNFVAGHVWEPRFLLPALLVDACAIALVGASVRQLVLLAELDYGLPVVEVQRELGRLRVLRIRTTKWTFVLSSLLWFPFLVVLFEGLFGVDLWRILAVAGSQSGSFLAWLVGNVLFGFAVALLVVWLSNRYADRAEGSPAIKRLMDDIAGRSLTRALASLDEIARFEAEPNGTEER